METGVFKRHEYLSRYDKNVRIGGGELRDLIYKM